MELHQTWHSVKLYGFDVVRYDSFYETTNWLRRTCSSNKEYFWHSFFFFFSYFFFFLTFHFFSSFFFLQTFVFNWWFKIFLWLVICSRKGKSPDRQIPFNFIFWVWGEKRKLFLYKCCGWGQNKIYMDLFICFLGLHLGTWRFPGQGSNQSYSCRPTATATAMDDRSRSSQQRWILNPLSEARDRTHHLMVTSWIRFCWAMTGTPIWIFEKLYQT